MVNRIVPFLRDVVTRVQVFNQVMTHVHLKEDEEGHVLASAPASDGSLQLSSRSKHPIDLGGARACLGNVSYLHMLLQSSLLTSNSDVELHTGDARNGKLIIRSMLFHMNDRTEIHYIASDPFRESIMKPTAVKIDKWPVLFEINDQVISEIAEIKKIHSAVPTGSSEDILQIMHSEGTISIEFGMDSHNTTLNLDVEVDSNTKKAFGVHLPSNALLNVLKLAQNKQGFETTAQLAEKALRINSESEHAIHEFTLVRRRMRDD